MVDQVKKVKKAAPVLLPKDTAIGKLFGGNYVSGVDHYDAHVRQYLEVHGTDKVDASLLPVIVDPTCRIGIEVEVENAHRYKDDYSVYAWQLHEDSSLRNNGREFVTFPIAGQQIPLALELLFKKVLREGYDFSKRTSVHVHMNVRNMTPSQVTAMVCLFTVFEKLLYRFVGHDRDKNIFCVPLQQTLISNALLDAMNTGFKNHRWYKYSGLNLLPISTQGSIEFRQLYGTDDVRLICTWINLLQRLRSYAARTPLDDVLREIKDLNTNSQYDYYVTRVFEDNVRDLDLSCLAEDVESGVICVKQCTLNNQYHQNILLSVVSTSELCAQVIKMMVKPKPIQLRYDVVEPEPIFTNEFLGQPLSQANSSEAVRRMIHEQPLNAAIARLQTPAREATGGIGDASIYARYFTASTAATPPRSR